MQTEKRLLPLNALRAFEAAGRHLHMRRAAEELCVSHSAISQQVRKLESMLEVPLFERSNRGLLLTAAGNRLLHDLTTALDSLVRATTSVARDSKAAELHVACAAGVATNWLVPNLSDFLQSYEDYDVRLDPIAVYPKEVPSDVDLAVTYGKPPVSEDRITRLSGSQLLPICCPDLMSDMDRSRSILDQLSRHTLLHADDGSEWQQWFRIAGAEGLCGRRNLYLNTGYHLILDCIRRGLGIGLIAKRFIEREIADGSLIVLQKETLFEPGYYYVVRPAEPYRSQAGRDFEQWVYKRWNQLG